MACHKFVPRVKTVSMLINFKVNLKTTVHDTTSCFCILQPMQLIDVVSQQRKRLLVVCGLNCE